MKAYGEIPRSLRPVRNFRQQQLIELRVRHVSLDHCLNHGADELLEGRVGIFDQRPLDEPIDLFDMPLVQRDKNGAFVRKILVDRSDADAGNFCDAVRRDRFDALAL